MTVYDIILHTPLGKKKGEMTAKIIKGKLKGSLSILGHTEPIEGIVDKSGQCALTGKITTLMRKIDFSAEGIMDYRTLHLAVKNDFGCFELVGQSRSRKEYAG